MKKLIWLIIVVAIVAIGWYMMSGNQADAPTEESTPETFNIEAELQGLGDADLDAELKAVDADIQAL